MANTLLQDTDASSRRHLANKYAVVGVDETADKPAQPWRFPQE